MKNKHKKITLFIILSLALHVIIVTVTPDAGNHAKDLLSFNQQTKQGGMPVVLLESTVVKNNPTEHAKTAQSVNSMTQQNKAARLKKKIKSTTTTQMQQTQVSGSKSLTDETYNARVKQLLSVRIKHAFNYPLLAIRKGWQGNVLLSMHINASGNITNIQIQKSSGYALLDKNAVKTLYKIRRITPGPELILAESTQIELPIEYRLVN